MTEYVLAVAAAWLLASLLMLLGRFTPRAGAAGATTYTPHDAPTTKRLLPVRFFSRFAFALILVYLLRQVAPAQVNLMTGVQVGVLAGLLIALPQALDQCARFQIPPKVVLSEAVIGLLQGVAAGAVAALLL